MIKNIPGFDDYCVSHKGEVFRIAVMNNTYVLKELKPYICNHHRCVKLRGKKYYISNLVAELFIGSKPEGYLVFHKNKDRLDDRYDNLVYLSPKDVQLYSTYTEEYLMNNIFR